MTDKPASKTKRKRPKTWSHTAGERPCSAYVRERTPGGMLQLGVWDPALGRPRWRSLGHRDRDRAIEAAQAEAKLLRQGADVLRGDRGLAGIITLYLVHRTPAKVADVQAMDERRAALWTRRLGHRQAPDLGPREWNEFIPLRQSGAIDARGEAVPEGARRPVRARAVAADLIWLVAVLNWACQWLVDGRPILERNPYGTPAPGVKRVLAWPVEKRPRRPAATWEMFERTMRHAPSVRMKVRKGTPGAVLTTMGTGRHPRTGTEIPVQWWTLPSYLPELLELAEQTGRRISAICQLWYSDLLWGPVARKGQPAQRTITHLRWRPFKGSEEAVLPVSRATRATLLRALEQRPGIGDAPLFPSTHAPGRPITRFLARDWLERAEDLAGVPRDMRGWHKYRRKWASERTHHADVDVMKGMGLKTRAALNNSYQQADDPNVLAVMEEPRKRRETQDAGGTG